MFAMLAVAVMFSFLISCSVRNVRADGNYTIEHVDHTISVLENGCVLMNDTVELSGQAPDNFSLGFPYIFGPYVLRCLASDASNPSNTFPVSLGEPLNGQSGFYGITVDFSKGAPQNFTVQVLFSNALVVQDTQNLTLYDAIFPTFPSLVTTADTFNASIILPRNAVYVQGTGETVGGLTYSAENLTAFAYNSSTVTFNIGNNEMQLFDVDQLNRVISMSQVGDMTGTDSYYITNKASNSIDSIDVLLPANASDVNAHDQFGRIMTQPTQTITDTSLYTVTLSLAVDPTQSSFFTVTYSLPSGVYIEQQGGSNSFALNMTMFQDLDYYINTTSVSFVLPEGATLQSFEDTLTGDSYSVSRGVFQEEASINMQGTDSLDSFSVGLVYDSSPLWVGFAPTLWVLTLAMIGCAAIVVSTRPKGPTPVSGPTTAGVRVRPEYITSFAESYEEKMKIMSEIDALESKAQKGRLPRRRYKVQLRTLETRLDTVSRSLTEAKGRMLSAGGHYASLMRELEVAEARINEYEANVKVIEGRHSRGELSLEAYRRLLGDYERRKERNETTIKGILLRLREEIQ
jgi:hypothetical protein